jgi:hypothetical protein
MLCDMTNGELGGSLEIQVGICRTDRWFEQARSAAIPQKKLAH